MIDTSGPYHAAYTVVAIAYAGYAVSIWWRLRKVRARLEQLRGASTRDSSRRSE
jgi:hypothetical protein